MDITRVFYSTHALHAASVHLPIGLGLLGLPLVFFTVLATRRWPNARLFAGVYFFVTSLLAVAAAVTGQRAASGLVALANATVESVVEQHRVFGFSISTLAFVISILLFASHIRARKNRGTIFASLAMLSTLALAFVILCAGSSGGRLVYGFGIGTPVGGVDALSGATLIVGANPTVKSPNSPPSAATRSMEESVDAKYTPHTKPIDTVQAASIRFKDNVAPILEQHCYKCHQGKKAEAGLDLSTQSGVLKGGDYAGAVVVPGEPDQSAIVMHIRGIYEPKMPKDSPELTEDELHTIRMWIKAGAKGD